MTDWIKIKGNFPKEGEVFDSWSPSGDPVIGRNKGCRICDCKMGKHLKIYAYNPLRIVVASHIMPVPANPDNC